MSGHVIQCWSCDTRLTLGERNENDGDCLECGVEIALDDYLDQAMTERDELRVQVEAMRADKAAIDLLNQYIVTAENPATGKIAICADSETLRDCMAATLQAKP